MSGPKSYSWHILRPRFSPGDDIVRVLFLQRLPHSSVSQILHSLNSYDWQWRDKFSSEPPRELESYPHLHDHDLGPNGICLFLDQLPYHDNSVQAIMLVDGDWDDDSCIVAASRRTPTGGLSVSAARVHQSIARPLASFLCDGIINSMVDALTDDFSDASVHLDSDYDPIVPQPNVAELPPLTFEPSDIALSGIDRLTVISLVPLGARGREELEKKS